MQLNDYPKTLCLSCMIPVFRCCVDEIYALLECHAA